MKLVCIGNSDSIEVKPASPRQVKEDKMRSVIVSSFVLLSIIQGWAQEAKTAAEKGRFVMTLESAWNQAEAVDDGTALKLLLADTFVFSDNSGNLMDRDGWLKSVRSEMKEHRGPASIAQTASVYGDTVIVTGIYREKLTIKGKNVDRSSRFTDTWVFQNYHWQCVASQSTLTSP